MGRPFYAGFLPSAQSGGRRRTLFDACHFDLGFFSVGHSAQRSEALDLCDARSFMCQILKCHIVVFIFSTGVSFSSIITSSFKRKKNLAYSTKFQRVGKPSHSLSGLCFGAHEFNIRCAPMLALPRLQRFSITLKETKSKTKTVLGFCQHSELGLPSQVLVIQLFLLLRHDDVNVPVQIHEFARQHAVLAVQVQLHLSDTLTFTRFAFV